MREIIVESCKNMYISKYMLGKFPNLSRNILYKSLRNKDIKVNGKRISSDIVISNKDKLVIYIDDIYLFNLPKKLDYIYKDNNILAVYKPQGLLSNNEDTTKNIGEPTLEDLVRKDFLNAKICHRLDRNTSGIILFALNTNAYKDIINGFNKNFIHKEYIAYVYNSKFDNKSDSITMYLRKDSNSSFVRIYPNMVKNSQKIITNYKIISKNDKMNFAVLNVEIPTGKTHQIRAQLAYINHPIIGDPKYSKNEINKKFKINKQLLFAYRYSFNFEENSILNYLNNKIIELERNYYNDKIGENYEK